LVTSRSGKAVPLALLFFLSPAIGELLSGSSPPAEFFSPFSLALLSCLYGSGAIIARELKVRWRKDFRAVLVLGGAYGILEEGLMVKSFFDPAWMDLGALGQFGRFLEVNWVWAVLLTVYHAVFSIAIPIALVEMALPRQRGERWTTDRQLHIFMVLIAAVTAFGFVFLTPYRPPPLQYSAAAACVLAAGWAAHRMGRLRWRPGGGAAPVRRMLLAGLAFATLFFIFDFLGPYIFLNPALNIAAVALLVFCMWRLLERYDWDWDGNIKPKLALVSGALLFFIVLAPLQQLDATRADTTSGMALVGIAAAALLMLLYCSISRQAQDQGAPSPQGE
jgi:hypothetical protein